jgi:tight adherence protein B
MMIALAVFAGIVATVLVPYFMFVVQPEDVSRRRLTSRLGNDQTAERVRAAIVREEQRLSSVGAIDQVLQRLGALVRPIQTNIDQAGYTFTPGRFLLLVLVAATVPGVVLTWWTGRLFVGVVVGAVAAMVPWLWLVQVRRRRVNKFEEQFPEGIDLMARALRAGHTFQTGLAMVAEEVPAPVGTEFRLLHEQQNFGMAVDEALRGFAERVPLIDAKFFSTAVLTQRDAAHGRITGVVLAGLPPKLALIFMVVSPRHMQTLFEDQLGIQMIIGAIVLQITGSLIIKKIVNIEY